VADQEAMATQPADLRMSLAEFLEWNDGSDTRYELIDGRVVAMAPPNPRRSAMTGRLSRLIGNALGPPCEIYVEAGIVTPGRADTYLQADLAVSCRPLDQQQRDVAEPVLVVEVESPGTARHDREVKLAAISSLPRCRRSCWWRARSAASNAGAAAASAGTTRP
jgi:Uma2 family endonuclease